MESTGTMPWVKINDFLLYCGSIRESRELCIGAVKKLSMLVPYDQARIYFVNDNGEIYDEALFGADKDWSKAYVDYFSQIENGRYSITRKHEEHRHMSPDFKGNIHDWTSRGRGEFVTDYIKPQGLKYSLGFGLQGVNNSVKCSFSLDRTKSGEYTPREIGIISVIQAHLDNLHQNLFVLSLEDNSYQNWQDDVPLTRRESEITGLLCNGITPGNIAQKLFISTATVYKHISNVYAKLKVVNRQELIIKMLNKQ